MITRTLIWFRNIKLCWIGIHKSRVVHKSKSHILFKCDHCGYRWSEINDTSNKIIKNGNRK
jgi:hypothetical protein